MGTTAFSETISATLHPDFRLAFSAARERAAQSYGQDSYSGSISEKSSVVPFPRALTDLRREGLSVPAVQAALEHPEASAVFLRAWPALAPDLRDAQYVYDDKWGPAVGFRFGNDWHFVGLASS